MTRFLFACLVAIGLFLPLLPQPAMAQDSVGYFSALPELPIPPGLQETPDSAIRFDQPEGRIIVLQAHGTATKEQITDFYKKTLPSLGWEATRDGVGRFTRGKESLVIEPRAPQHNTTRLKILLSPL